MPAKVRDVAVALVYDRQTGRFLMVTSRAYPTYWLFPKGGVEEGESSGEAAVRESREEAGTPQNLDAPADDERLLMLALGESKHKRTSIWHVHVLETSEAAVNAQTHWPEVGQRRRQWFSAAEALENISVWSRLSGDSDEQEAEEAEGKKPKAKKGKEKGGALEQILRTFLDREKHLASGR